MKLKIPCGLLVLVSVGLAGCPIDRSQGQLYFRNNADVPIKVLYNSSFPDSSLRNAILDVYISPHKGSYVASWIDLRSLKGVTLFVFDKSYVDRKWHENVGSPDNYLEGDSVLRRYSLSIRVLDSLGWKVAFP